MIPHNIARKLGALLLRHDELPAEVASGTVTRVDEDGVVWVQLYGAEDETPCETATVDVHEGDEVTVTIDGGSASIGGNVSRPATDDEVAQEARSLASSAATIAQAVSDELPKVRAVAVRVAEVAQGIAQEAQAIAEATNQHFFADGNGVHVTEVENDPTTEHNILINSLGILLRKATLPLVAISQSAIAFYDGVGNAASNIVARFGADGSQIGKSDESHVEIDNLGMTLRNESGAHTYSVRNDISGGSYVEGMKAYAFSWSDFPLTISDAAGWVIVDANVTALSGDSLTTQVDPSRTHYTSAQMDAFAELSTTNVGRGDWWDVVDGSIVVNTVSGEAATALDKGYGACIAINYTCTTDAVAALTLGTRKEYSDLVENSATFGEGLLGDSPNSVTLGRYDAARGTKQYPIKVGGGTSDSDRKTVYSVDASGISEGWGFVAVSPANSSVRCALQPEGITGADTIRVESGGSKGLLTTDSTGFEYPLISDNGNNLWIGAHKAGEQHHTGGTFISAGAGRDSIYVSVPNSDNTGATNYPALHTGYPVTTTTTISDVISAQTGATVSSASFSQWGKFCMLSVTYTLSSEISVPANGNTANTALFTIAAGKRPVEYLDVMLDVNVGAWGHITTGGVVSLDGANSRGAAWTLDTTTARYLRCCYLLP